MGFLDDVSVWVAVGVFVGAAVVVWLAGARAARLADAVSDRTRLGKAFAGFVILAIATDAPEIGTTVTAAVAGDAGLATNNMFGGIAFQTFILVIIDVALIKGALTHAADRPALRVQAAFLVLLLGLLLIPVVSGFHLAVFAVSPWAVLLMILYFAGAYLSQHDEGESDEDAPDLAPEDEADKSLTRVVVSFAGVVLVIFLAGVALAQSGESIAASTGLGTSFVGATLVAISTSLPELSTSITAVRIGNVEMAVGNILGSNAGMLVTLFVAEVAFRDGAILAAADSSAVFSIVLGIVMTAVYLIGLTRRSDRTLWRFGLDSAAVAALYVVGLITLYQLR